MRLRQTALRLFTLVSIAAPGSFGCASGSDAESTASSAAASQAEPSISSALPSEGATPAAEESAPSYGQTENGSSSTPASTPEMPSGVNTTPAGAGAEGAATSNGGMLATGTGAEPSGGAGETGAASAPKFHVFLLLGQSNMAGYPKAQQADRAEDPRVRVLGFDNCAATGRQTDVWDVAAPPLHECWNDGLGPGDYFAKTLLAVIPPADSIGLVPSAISGERIEAFLKVGGTRYDRLLQRARLAQQAGGVIEGMLFHQGESNTGDPSWPGKVKTLVTDLRADLGVGDVPFLAGELLYTGGSSSHNPLVKQLPNLISNARVISASGLVVDPIDTQWNLHFDHDSQVEFGKRYARAMIEALGW